MDWKTIYKQRLTTAEQAVKKIKSGDRVVIGHAVGEPYHVVDTMVENAAANNYSEVEIVQLVPMGKCLYAKPGMEPYFRVNVLFAGAGTRDSINSGHGNFTPSFFHKVPSLFDTTLKLDVALVHVSPPDAHGYCSLGVGVDYTKRAIETAKLVIAQVNEQMPRTLGDSFVHVSQLDEIIQHNEPLVELQPPNITDVERAIGENCASLVRDGDTLQLGIGAIPDAVLLFLKDKKDLGVHTEMFSDGMLELIEKGVVNNSKKTINKGKFVATFLMGTKKLYDFVDNNPAVAMYTVDYVNDPVIAASNDNLVAINSAVQVDFMGQVCSESIGARQISGVGGQVDFVRGASMSRGGRAIIAMPSTAAGGKVSKIVPMLDEGAAVTTSRTDVEYVVTEYGIANLRGQTLKNRARSLIGIAHPKFHDELKAAFEKRFNTKF